ncbi:hypothetical protein ACVWXO_005530 [Bradyrhizobium sp. LM2.7]
MAGTEEWACGAAEQKNGRTRFPASVISIMKKSLVHLIRRGQVIPMLGREVIEGQQRVAVLGEAFDRSAVLGAVFLGEGADRRFGGRPVRRPVDFAQVLLHVGLDRERDLVQDVYGLVHPAALVPCAGKDLVERLPEAERAVANGNFRGDLQPALLHVDQELTPALRALPDADLKANQFLLAFRRRADQHQHAFAVVFHARLQEDAIGPHIHIASRRQIALLPALILALPLGRQPGDDRPRQVRRVLAQQGRQRLLEIAGRDAAQRDNVASLVHGVSLSLRGSGRLDTRLDTPPISFRHHPLSCIARSQAGQFQRATSRVVTVGAYRDGKSQPPHPSVLSASLLEASDYLLDHDIA